jgi:hypothetical protein
MEQVIFDWDQYKQKNGTAVKLFRNLKGYITSLAFLRAFSLMQIEQ